MAQSITPQAKTLAESRGVEVERAVEVAREYLEKQEAIEKVWTREQIETGTSEVARLYRNSYDPERSGDLIVQLAPTCLVSFYDQGTTHGTPYDYDRRVPWLLRLPSAAHGQVTEPVLTVDVAPTLGEILGLPLPEDLDGQSRLSLMTDASSHRLAPAHTPPRDAPGARRSSGRARCSSSLDGCPPRRIALAYVGTRPRRD